MCAVRRFVVSPAQSGGTGGRFLGRLTYLEAKAEGDQQHVREAVAVREASTGVVPRDPRDMAKA